MYEFKVLYRQFNIGGSISFQYLNKLVKFKFFNWLYSNIAHFKLHISNTLELSKISDFKLDITSTDKIMNSIINKDGIFSYNTINDKKQDVLDLNSLAYPYNLSDKNAYIDTLSDMAKLVDKECKFNELLHTNKSKYDMNFSTIDFMEKSAQDMIDMYIKCADSKTKELITSTTTEFTKDIKNMTYNDIYNILDKDIKDSIHSTINFMTKQVKDVDVIDTNILLNKQEDIVDIISAINFVLYEQYDTTLSEIALLHKDPRKASIIDTGPQVKRDTKSTILNNNVVQITRNTKDTILDESKELKTNLYIANSIDNKLLQVQQYEANMEESDIYDKPINDGTYRLDDAYKIPDNIGDIRGFTVEMTRITEVIGDLFYDGIAKIDEDFTNEMDRVPTHEDQDDIVDIPNEDYDYATADLFVYNENGVPTIPVDRYSMSQPKIRIHIPTVHCLAKYDKIGITDDLINVNAYVIRDMVMLYHYIRKRYTDNLMAADPREAAEFMLDKLYESVGNLKDIYGKLLWEQFDKAFRLARWYSASIVNRYSEFWLIRDYGCYITPLYSDVLDMKFITRFEGFELGTGKLVNRYDNALLELTYDSFIDEQFTVVLNTVYNGSIPSNCATITIDGVITQLATNQITVIAKDMPIGNHIILIESKDVNVIITTIKYGGCIFKGASTEYIKNSADGLLVISEIEQEMVYYWQTHHAEQTKGNLKHILGGI